MLTWLSVFWHQGLLALVTRLGSEEAYSFLFGADAAA